jgi:D-alanyl-D-alanine carboxypeptidase
MLTSFLNLYATITLGGTPADISGTSAKPEPVVLTYEDTLPASMIPVKKPNAVEPVIGADAAIIADFESGEVLWGKNHNKKMQIASITKLMTAIVALEQGDISENVIVSRNAANTGGSKIWLYSGEEITLSNLLKASLIHSGNDAAIAISEHIGGSTEEFVKKMNQKAKELRLYGTKFANPIGFDDLNNHSTVRDLSLLARYAYRKPFIRNAVKTKTTTIASTDGKLTHDLTSTNKLLDSFLNVMGLKTGHTEAAGLCFVSIIENDKGNKIITVVLNSPDRFAETKMLASWAFRSYIW